MGKEAAILLFLGVFYLKISFVASVNSSSIDESSLLALKAHINSSILSKNWSEETSFCAWIGVICGSGHPRVTGLDLSNMGLRGTIAREIGNLSFLKSLDMSNNSIHGPIPDEIGNLRGLLVLNMATNQLNDHIPDSLGLLTNLDGLNLSNNFFTGNIPVGFGNLSGLWDFRLSNNQLTGELPSTIFNISSLGIIDVSMNQMSGRIPKDICFQLASKLQFLVLHKNQFGGEISLSPCNSLKVLSLADNHFTGNILTGFWNLSAIQVVGLANNGFTGTIPPSIGNLTNLNAFDVPINSFHGTVPVEIGQLLSLQHLALDMNMLNGEVPRSVFNLSRLQTLSLSLNNLSGVLPSFVDIGLPSIEHLFLGQNKFRGKIPNSISNLAELKILDLSDNSFTEDVPITIGNLSQLQTLWLGNNHLTSNVSKHEQDFLSSLVNCKYLESIAMEHNPITGVLPKSLGSTNLSASLQKFTAHFCRIVGSVPHEVGNLSNLLWLNLGNNDLTGAIPEALGYLRNLQKLDLYGNKFQGPIFHVLCNLKNLAYIDLRENSFFEPLPRCLGNLSMLREISLADNAFNSSIPSTLWSNERLEKIDFSYNILDGSLSQEIGNLKSLRELNLSGNQISGSIPPSISGLQSLINLSLSNNKFGGPIHESFADLKDLQYLDLSHNSFSGSIPKSLETLTYLTYFNVSFNQLSGKIPDGGPFVSFTAEFFKDNKGLCGAPRFKVEDCKSSMSSKNKHLKYILLTVTSVILATIFLILVLRNRCTKQSPPYFSFLPLGHVHERISYHEVLRATNHFVEENLIGRGSYGLVYKGKLSSSRVVAIKVFNSDVLGALKSFVTECQILGSIRHRNLVKVITACSSLNFKALVMEYMPNGNLEQWLYSATSNIFQRLGIMIDVASAIEYLHDGLQFPIAHCDLKPNNILLDEDMVAHVGDFGIAKLLTEEQRIQQTRTFGTIGYMAPEYGSDGLASTMVDVYSYGILLVEMFSRRKPTDEMFSGDLTMKKWVQKSFPTSVELIIDNELLKMNDDNIRAEHINCLTSIIEVALDCTADLPEERPSMKDVLARINKISLACQSQQKK